MASESTDVEGSSLVYFQRDNDFDDDRFGRRLRARRDSTPAPDSNLKELIVWGGCVANCGEDALSQIVDAHATTLQTVVYCPDRTKGGCLIRPKYYRGDRGGTASFPNLTALTIRLDPVLMPQQYGWITPELRRLRLLCVTRALKRSRGEGNRPLADVRLPSKRSLRTWLGAGESGDWSHNARKGYPQKCLDFCPKLESITIAFCSSDDELREEVDWITLLPPAPVPWCVQRLVLLAVVKPWSQGMDGADSWMDNQLQPSGLSALTLPLANTILSFLGCPFWTHRAHKMSTESAEKFGIPDELRMTMFEDVVRPDSSAKGAWEILSS